MRAFAGPVSGKRPVVYVGHGWTVPGKNIDPFAGVDVKGKIVVAHGPRALPKGVDIPLIGRVNVGASTVFAEAERRGAAAVLLIPQASALASWAQARTQNTTTRELHPIVPSAYAAVPITTVMVAPQVTDALMAGERVAGAALMARAEAQDYPESFQLTKSIIVDLPAKSTIDHQPYNVVAVLKGSDPILSREYIVIESHLDGAVGTRAVNGDDIYNSADDNASGSAGDAGDRRGPRGRPAAETIGPLSLGQRRGARAVGHALFRLPPAGAARSDRRRVQRRHDRRQPGAGFAGCGCRGHDRPERGLSDRAGRAQHRASTRCSTPINRGYLNLRFNREHDRGDSEFFYPRSDAGPFLERGILTIGFTTGMHARYHGPADEARFLDPAKMEAISRTIYALAWTLADAPERPRIDKPMPATVPRYK